MVLLQAMKIFDKQALMKKRDYVKVGMRRVMVTALDKVRKELAIMKKVMHQCVVRCFEIIEDSDGDEVYLGRELLWFRLECVVRGAVCGVVWCGVR